MVKIKGRIVKIGTSYAFRIPKSLLDSGILRERELVEFELTESDYIKSIVRKYKQDTKAFSETWSRDSIRGLAGFPESVL